MGGRVDVCAAKYGGTGRGGLGGWNCFLLWLGLTAFYGCFVSTLLAPFWPTPSSPLRPKPPKNHNYSQIIKHTKQIKLPLCEYASLVTPSLWETPPSLTVTGRISQVSQACSRFCTLKAEWRGKARASGRVWTCWFLETRGRVGQRHAQESWQTQKGEEKKSLMSQPLVHLTKSGILLVPWAPGWARVRGITWVCRSGMTMDELISNNFLM